jgi:glycosyltransferase involved in cell wall biosynthesis
MRIAFNAQLLSAPRSGTGRYIYNLLEALGQLDLSSTYHILSSQRLSERPATPANMRWDVIRQSGLATRSAALEKVVWEQRVFTRAARALRADVLHIPYFAPPVRAYTIPTIVTIHDVISQRLPEYHASLGMRTYSQFVARAAPRATAIIAVSHHGKQDIATTLGIPAERIAVIYEAPDPRFAPASTEAQQELRQRLGLAGPFVLNVGGMDARKNIAGLIRAFAEARRHLGDPELRLFITGNPDKLSANPLFPDWRPLARDLGVADHIICSTVSEADLTLLYSATDCFAFTSLYEGFGLTPLEAMACGAPVVCSDKTSLPEVVGDAGLLVDPLDIQALSAAILRVLTVPNLTRELRARGLARAKQFTWGQVARATLDVYTETRRRTSHDGY